MGCGKSVIIPADETADYVRKSPTQGGKSQLKFDYTYSLTTWNEAEIDRTHFTTSSQLLGVGGFGIVRLVQKISGQNKGETYALKSLSKAAVLQRPSGISSIMSELNSPLRYKIFHLKV